jgi:hypothetical protein
MDVLRIFRRCTGCEWVLGGSATHRLTTDPACHRHGLQSRQHDAGSSRLESDLGTGSLGGTPASLRADRSEID